MVSGQPVQPNGTSAWTAPPRAARQQNPIVPDSASLARGKEAYTAGCLPCHGVSGKGDGVAAVSLLPRKPGNLSDPKMLLQTDGAIFWKISEGNSPMPSFRDAFPEKQRWDIVNYVRTLAPKSSNAPIASPPAIAPQASNPPTNLPPPTATASSPTAPAPLVGDGKQFVTREQYNQLLAEHTQLLEQMKEMQEFKAKMEAALGKVGPATNSETDQALDDLDRKISAVDHKVKETYPGSTKFLLTGYGSASYVGRQKEPSFFDATFNPILLWKVSDRLLFEGELEAELDSESNDTHIALELAQASYLLNDYMTIGVGKFLNPMNYFVERQHMAWVNKFPDKPFAVYDGLLPETELGAQLRGAIPIGARSKLGYALYVANAPTLVTTPADKTDLSDLGTLSFDNFGNINDHFSVGGRIGFLPMPELEVGYGFQYSGVGPAGMSADALLQSADLTYVRDSERLKGILNFHAQWVWSHVNHVAFDPDGSLGFGPISFKNHRDGGYAQIAYRPTHVQNVLKNFEPVVRYDMFNQGSTPVGFDEKRWSIGLNYWLTPSTVVKSAYEFDHKTGGGENQDAVLLQFATGF